MTKHIHFTKMHGAGNDYIYVYTPEYPIEHPEAASIAWSKFHFGIGSDGLILIGKSDKADFSMRIFNNDGSEAMMCGNGTRCVGKFVYDHHLTDKTEITLDTLSGIKKIQLIVENGKAVAATVNMGEPVLSNKQQLATPTGSMTAGTITADGIEYIGTYVCMGNPHFVIFVDDVMSIPVSEIGPKLEFNPIFPERCNIEFAQIREDGSIRMRVWERGSGITMACGTGACATAVAACLNNKTGRTSQVEMDGGTLTIEWNENDNRIYMTGPAATAFEGDIELDE
ncbi:MAG: diaminopimelate epimerase [Bacteroidales bacterium]|nr:diaminopimelate epimerase [Candidatus Minthousia equi]MDO4956082.1 diaminopimelate epimerase [Bacteroidales bacterium]